MRISVCCTTSATRAVLADLLNSFQDAQIEHWRAIAFFLHTGTENQSALPVRTDQEWYTTAWFHVNRYSSKLLDIKDDLTYAKSFNTTNTVYQDYLWRARNVWVSSALAQIAQMNPALPYADPWPILAPGKTVYTVVGPHGDYRMMQWRVNRGKNYAMDAYGSLIHLYRPGADGPMIRDIWVESSAMLDTLDRVSGLLANVTFTTEEASEDRFCRVLRVQKLLTITAADRFKRWNDFVAKLLPAAYQPIFFKLADSWRHAIDRGSWQGLVFPETERCSSPFLQD